MFGEGLLLSVHELCSPSGRSLSPWILWSRGQHPHPHPPPPSPRPPLLVRTLVLTLVMIQPPGEAIR
ncbi:hypothetical protein RSAG8_10368, partial [Rhizoctonia solani AG-8 WAC10335]